MTASHAADIVNGYLARLEAEAADLPKTERRELIDGVREHIAEVRAEMPDESDVALLNLLDQLGDPSMLAAEERERLGLTAQQPPSIGWVEVGALILTPLLWPVGIILLWTSPAWSLRDKLIGTLIPPGGLFTSFLLLAASLLVRSAHTCSGGTNGTTCSGGLHGPEAIIVGILFLLVLVSPVLTGIYLGTRLRGTTHSH